MITSTKTRYTTHRGTHYTLHNTNMSTSLQRQHWQIVLNYRFYEVMHSIAFTSIYFQLFKTRFAKLITLWNCPSLIKWHCNKTRTSETSGLLQKSFFKTHEIFKDCFILFSYKHRHIYCRVCRFRPDGGCMVSTEDENLVQLACRMGSNNHSFARYAAPQLL